MTEDVRARIRDAFTRRRFLAGVAGAGTISGMSASAVGMPPAPDDPPGPSIPDVAWRRPLGDHPGGDRRSNSGNIGEYPYGKQAPLNTKRGVPLGGIGAGSFMYNLAGTFGPWEFDIGTHEERFLSDGAFHLYDATADGSDASVRTLATDDVPAVWSSLDVGDGTYHALFPRGWTTYDSAAIGGGTELALEFFSPIIANNYRETSYPVASFTAHLRNPTDETREAAVMFTFPNAPYVVRRDIPRQGLENRVERDGANTGIVMSATDPENPPVTDSTQWCIATAGGDTRRVSAVESWSDPGTLYDSFASDGRLTEETLSTDGAAGAVAVTVQLPPGAERELPFALAWDFPIYEFDAGTQWAKRYTEYFDHDATDPEPEYAFDIATKALSNCRNWGSAIDDWIDPIVENPAYPDWLKQAALNILYHDTFSGAFWENGLLNRERTVGTHDDQHLWFELESMAFQYANPIGARHYHARHLNVLWPKIERDMLLAWSDLTDENTQYGGEGAGHVPHDCGTAYETDTDDLGHSSGDPWFDYPAHPHSNELNKKDAQPKYILEVYQHYYHTGDDEFLDAVWPTVTDAYEFEKSLDRDGDFLPEHAGPDTAYDIWTMAGSSSYIGSTWVATVEAVAEMAAAQGDTETEQDARTWAEGASESIATKLWVETPIGGYYRKDTASSDNMAVMPDAVHGAKYAYSNGLGDVLPADRVAEHLRTVFYNNVEPLPDYDGDGVGDVGALNASQVMDPVKQVTDRSTDDLDDVTNPSPYAWEVWGGVSYFQAASMWHLGQRLDDDELLDMALATAWGIYYQNWVNEETAYWFDCPEGWHHERPQYNKMLQMTRVKAIWELLLEIDDPYADRP